MFEIYDVVYLLQDRGVVLSSTKDKVIVSFDNGTVGAYNSFGALFEGDPVKLSFTPYDDPYTGITQVREHAEKEFKDKSAEIAKIHEIYGILAEGAADFQKHNLISKGVLESKEKVEELITKIEELLKGIAGEIKVPIGAIIDNEKVVREFKFERESIFLNLYDIKSGHYEKEEYTLADFLVKFSNSTIEYFK